MPKLLMLFAEWVDSVGQFVVMRDFMALSFALDYENEDGDPGKPQTAIGALRARAKPYRGQEPTRDTIVAASELGGRCSAFLNEMTCYESADCVVAMPPSDPTKNYNLPRQVAARIAEQWGRENLTSHVRTPHARDSIKGSR
jgi:hypothetical protein